MNENLDKIEKLVELYEKGAIDKKEFQSMKDNIINSDGEDIKSDIESKSGSLTSPNVLPFPYIISEWKLIILSISTGGIYNIYWFYKHFKSFKKEGEWKITPWARAIFAPVTAHSLFKEVLELSQKYDKKKDLPVGWLATAFFVLNILSRLPDPYWLLYFLSVIPLIPVQRLINFYWDKKYGNRVAVSKFNTWNYLTVVVGAIMIFFTLIGLSEGVIDNSYSNDTSGYYNQNSDGNSNFSLEAEYKKNFMNSCVASGEGLESTCACILGYLVSNYSISDRIKMDEEYLRTEELPDAMYEAIDYCSN